MVKVLGIPLYDNTIEQACDELIVATTVAQPTTRCVSATGAHGLVYAYRNDEFKRILLSFFINLPDGMPAVWVGRLKGAGKMRRCYGPDFFAEMMKLTAKTEIKHYFCGGVEGVASQLKCEVSKKFNNNNVVGSFCPPFLDVKDYDYFEISTRIREAKADLVWIGLSTPKQEKFAHRLASYNPGSFIICVGAAFDFHTGRLTQAPSFMQNLGLEWLFRLTIEPTRLFRRYAEIVPLFIYFNFKELLTFATRNVFGK